MREALEQAREWARAGVAVALARVTRVVGSAPRPLGSAMAISADHRFAGSVSGGCVEGSVIQAAEDVLADGRAVTLDFSGDADPLTEIVLGCGGEASVFIERVDRDGDLAPVYVALLERLRAEDEVTLATTLVPAPAHWLLDAVGAVLAADTARQPDADACTYRFAAPVRLVIVGADAIGHAVAQFARTLGWPATVVDPRGAWLTPQRFPTAHRLVSWPQEVLPDLPLDARTAIVVLTHDPKIDEPALLAALRSDAGYVGALGSRTANADRLVRLRAAGLTPDEIARLHSPIGLDLGGRTPEEMALSIVAEIVAARNARAGGPLRQGTGPIHNQG